MENYLFKTCYNTFKAQKFVIVCVKTSKSLTEPVYVVNEINCKWYYAKLPYNQKLIIYFKV